MAKGVKTGKVNRSEMIREAVKAMGGKPTYGEVQAWAKKTHGENLNVASTVFYRQREKAIKSRNLNHMRAKVQPLKSALYNGIFNRVVDKQPDNENHGLKNSQIAEMNRLLDAQTLKGFMRNREWGFERLQAACNVLESLQIS